MGSDKKHSHKRHSHKRHSHKKTHKKRHSHKKFKEEKCSPKRKSEKLDFTCYNKESLHYLKGWWNIRHPDVTIDSNDPREIWNNLRFYMRKTCNKESCWLKHKSIKHDLPNDMYLTNFSPKQPKEWKKKPHTWLTSIEIEELMQQYEKKYKSFVFLGPSPVDYNKHKYHNECVWEEICKFSLFNMKKKGISKVGLIFNLDPHYKEGSHWVAMFINIRKKFIYYFDSYGDEIPARIMKFVRNIKKQGRHLGEKYKFHQTTRRHQYLSTECGMYSLYFIIKLLGGVKIEFFDKRINDKYMRKLRSIYFNKR